MQDTSTLKVTGKKEINIMHKEKKNDQNKILVGLDNVEENFQL